jgi:hypothetical protein
MPIGPVNGPKSIDLTSSLSPREATDRPSSHDCCGDYRSRRKPRLKIPSWGRRDLKLLYQRSLASAAKMAKKGPRVTAKVSPTAITARGQGPRGVTEIEDDWLKPLVDRDGILASHSHSCEPRQSSTRGWLAVIFSNTWIDPAGQGSCGRRIVAPTCAGRRRPGGKCADRRRCWCRTHIRARPCWTSGPS